MKQEENSKVLGARSDEELMQLYQSGDSAAFEQLYARYSARVYGYLRKRFPQREQADEAFQGVFMKLHQTRSRYDPKFLFSQWIFVISRSVALDHLRKSGRQAELLGSPEFDEVLSRQLSRGPDQAAGEALDPTILEDLPPEQRRVIEMRVIEEMAYDQIAERLQRSEAGVRQIFSRAIRRLRASAALAGRAKP